MRAVKLTKEQLEDLEEAQALRLTVKESVTLRFPDLHGQEWELRVYEPRLEPLPPDFRSATCDAARWSAADYRRPVSIKG